MQINFDIREKLNKVLSRFLYGFGFCADWFCMAFWNAVVCIFMAYMASILWTLWEKTEENHWPLIALLTACIVIALWDVCTKRKEKKAAEASQASEAAKAKKTASLSKADALTLAGAVDFLSAVQPDYYNSAEVQAARRRLQSAIDALEKAKA